MATHNHTGTIWGNVEGVAHRRTGPGTNFEIIDGLQPGQQVIVLCYALGESETFTTSHGNTNTSSAWDFVVTSDQDPGGYVADVLIDTGDNIITQLGPQGTCDLLQQRLANSSGSNQSVGLA